MFSPLEHIPNVAAVAARFRRKFRVKALYRDVFGSPAGQKVLQDLGRRAGILETSFQPGDPHYTAWHDGRRSLFLEIVRELRWSEAEIMQLAAAQDPDALAAQREAEAA